MKIDPDLTDDYLPSEMAQPLTKVGTLAVGQVWQENDDRFIRHVIILGEVVRHLKYHPQARDDNDYEEIYEPVPEGPDGVLSCLLEGKIRIYCVETENESVSLATRFSGRKSGYFYVANYDFLWRERHDAEVARYNGRDEESASLLGRQRREDA